MTTILTQGVAVEQQKTIAAVGERALEIDKLSKHYKQALEDFQDMGAKLENRRKELVEELEDANRRKDEQLAKLKELELQDIELKEKSLNKIPELEAQLQRTIDQLISQVEIITPVDATDHFSKYWATSSLSTERIPNTDFWISGKRGSGKSTFINYLTTKRIIDSFNDDSLNNIIKIYSCYKNKESQDDSDDDKG